MSRPVELFLSTDARSFYTGDTWVSRDGIEWHRKDSEEGQRIAAEWSQWVALPPEDRGVITISMDTDEDQ